MSFQHNLWVFIWFLWLLVVSISYCLLCTHSPISKIYNTSSPSHFSLLIGSLNIKKRTCSNSFSFLFLFFASFSSSFFHFSHSFLLHTVFVYFQDGNRILYRKFYDFLSLFSLMDFYVLLLVPIWVLEMLIFSICKMDVKFFWHSSIFCLSMASTTRWH